MKISLVTTCYNSEKTLERCINSVLSQTRMPDEFILVNDGSTDNTRDIMKGFSMLNTPIDIRIIDMPVNMGAGIAKIAGIKSTTGDVVTFLDSDDELEDWVLQEMESVMEKDDSDIVCVPCMIIKEDGSRSPEAFYPGAYDFPSGFERFTNYNFINTFANGKLIKKEILDKIEYSCNRYEEDSDTLYKWFYMAKRVSVLDRPGYNYYIYNNSLSRQKLSVKKVIDGLNALYGEILMRKSIGLKVNKQIIIHRVIMVSMAISEVKECISLTEWDDIQIKIAESKIDYLQRLVGIEGD